MPVSIVFCSASCVHIGDHEDFAARRIDRHADDEAGRVEAGREVGPFFERSMPLVMGRSTG